MQGTENLWVACLGALYTGSMTLTFALAGDAAKFAWAALCALGSAAVVLWAWKARWDLPGWLQRRVRENEELRRALGGDGNA